MPAPLLALALRLGIKKAAQIVKDKGYKFLQRKVNKALKSKTKQQESAEKAYKGKGSKRQKGKVTQRKKPTVDSGLSIKKKQTNKTKKVDKTKSYKVTPKSFKKKPMTQAQARHATRPQKKYEEIWEHKGKKYIVRDSDGSKAAAARGMNKLDRYDASKQRHKPHRLSTKKGEVKELKQETSHGHWAETDKGKDHHSSLKRRMRD